MTTTAIGTLTISTAPRDPAMLATVGRYRLRRLAEELKLVEDEAQKTAFMASPLDVMSQAIATALKSLDDGGTVAPVLPPALPTPEPVVTTPAVARVGDTITLTPPVAVTPVEAPEVAREPRTRKTRGKAAVEEVVQAVPDKDYVLVKAESKLDVDTLNTLARAVLGLAEIQKYNLAILMALAEASPEINASRATIINTAIADAEDIFEDISNGVKSALRGKA